VVAGEQLLFLHSTFLFIGLGLKFLDNRSQSSINGSPQNLHTSLVWHQALKPSFENFSPPPLKNLAGEHQPICCTHCTGGLTMCCKRRSPGITDDVTLSSANHQRDPGMPTWLSAACGWLSAM